MSERNMKSMIYPKIFQPWIVLGIIFVFFSSCNTAITYQENSSLEGDAWMRNDVKQFSFMIEDSIQTYDMYINLRNTTSYSYRNIYLFIDTYFPNGMHFRDTLQAFLAAPNGKWYGKGSGRLRDNSIPYRFNVRFPDAGTYKMDIEQAMRIEKLQGISDVGLKIKEHTIDN